jgi:cell division protein FtsB
MRVGKYLLGLWIAAAVYTFFSVLSGPKGVSAYGELLTERERQWNNLKNLGAVNEELEKTKNSLLYDKDTLAVYARQLGYGEENERFIRIVGLGGSKIPHAAAGQVDFAASPDQVPANTIKIAALCAGLAVCILFLVLDLLSRTQ